MKLSIKTKQRALGIMYGGLFAKGARLEESTTN